MHGGPGGHLAEYLVDRGLLTPDDVRQALALQHEHPKKRFVDVLLESKLIGAEQLSAVFPKLLLLETAVDPEVSHFADSFVHERFQTGETIFHQGEIGKRAYLLLAGSVRIVHSGAAPYLLGVVRPGELFGEMALVDEGLRSATAEAAEDCETMVLAREDFLAQVRARHESALDVIGLLARRLRSADELIAMLVDGVPDLS